MRPPLGPGEPAMRHAAGVALLVPGRARATHTRGLSHYLRSPATPAGGGRGAGSRVHRLATAYLHVRCPPFYAQEDITPWDPWGCQCNEAAGGLPGLLSLPQSI